MANRLSFETSPYLLQHAENPVDWYPWGDEALTKAIENQTPILLSVGYSACHWCHVMAHESFENPDIAEIMNRYFVCIKVDREERPDIDHIYMNAVQMMSGQGGWPMTCFLTPDGKPFYGGTYFPPEDRYGRPGFPRILHAVAAAWQEKRDEILEQGEAIQEQILASANINKSSGKVDSATLTKAFERFSRDFDERLGGFGSAPKFPQAMNIEFLLRYWHRTKNQQSLNMALFTLDRMAMGGIYDHLGGGFHRYSTDEYWLVPHFEKMLYDNAQLVLTYLHAYQITGNTFYKNVVIETLDYVIREMQHHDGGFYSAQDADSEGVEGKFFVWSEAEIKSILDEDFSLFSRLYDVTPRGNWEGKTILNLSAPIEKFAKSIDQDVKQFSTRVSEMRQKLFEFREKRPKPFRDEKILTSWNGLMMSAFAESGAVLGQSKYTEAAIRCATFLLDNLYVGGRLLRTGKHIAGNFNVAEIPGFLEDYANFVDGLLSLYSATWDLEWLRLARKLAGEMITLFFDNGQFYDTPASMTPLIARPADYMDNATPSGNSVAADVLLRLSVYFEDNRFRDIGDECIRKHVGMMSLHSGAFGRLLSAAEFEVSPRREVAIITGNCHDDVGQIVAHINNQYFPDTVVQVSNKDTATVDEFPILRGKSSVDNKLTVYICENYVCQQPVVGLDSCVVALENI